MLECFTIIIIEDAIVFISSLSLRWYVSFTCYYIFIICTFEYIDRYAYQDREKASARKRNSTVSCSSSNCDEQSVEVLSERQYGICYQNTVATEANNGKQVSFKHSETPKGNYLLPDFGNGSTIEQHFKSETTIQPKQDQGGRMHSQDVNANKASEVCLSFTSDCTNERKSNVVVLSKADTGETCFQIHTPPKTPRGNSFHNDEMQI